MSVRKVYKRGSSYETTIPKPLLFHIDETKKHDITFSFDPKTKRWYVEVDERVEGEKKS